jgi:hypothetical protein
MLRIPPPAHPWPFPWGMPLGSQGPPPAPQLTDCLPGWVAGWVQGMSLQDAMSLVKGSRSQAHPYIDCWKVRAGLPCLCSCRPRTHLGTLGGRGRETKKRPGLQGSLATFIRHPACMESACSRTDLCYASTDVTAAARTSQTSRTTNT